MVQHERPTRREPQVELRFRRRLRHGRFFEFRTQRRRFARSRRSRPRSASATATTSTTHSGWPRSSTAAGQHYVFGRLEQKTHSLTLRVNYTMTPNLSLQIYGQPFVSAGHYVNYKELVDGRAERYEDRYAPYAYAGNADFNVLSFRTTNVLRWEYRPARRCSSCGSRAARAGSARTLRFRPRLLGSLLHACGQHAARQVRLLDESVALEAAWPRGYRLTRRHGLYFARMRFDPEYVSQVLNENFEDAKALFLSPLIAIHYAHLVMLADRGIIDAAACARASRRRSIRSPSPPFARRRTTEPARISSRTSSASWSMPAARTSPADSTPPAAATTST